MTIQDRIDEIINSIENLILLHLDGEEQETVLGMVEELGWQWQQTNAHARTMTVCAAVMAGEKWNPEATTEEEIQHLETVGGEAMIQAVGMNAWAGLVQYFLPKPDGLGLEDEEEEEEDGEGDGDD